MCRRASRLPRPTLATVAMGVVTCRTSAVKRYVPAARARSHAATTGFGLTLARTEGRHHRVIALRAIRAKTNRRRDEVDMTWSPFLGLATWHGDNTLSRRV